MSSFRDDGGCFVCGAGNDSGLHLDFRLDAGAGTAETRVAFPARFQGWAGVTHGGLLATVLDETLVKAAAARGLACVTGEITVRYKQPAPVERPLTAWGLVLERRGRMVLARAEIRDSENRILASASGKLFTV